MANIMDYLDWRGDILFSERDINEVDNLIFAYLSYVKFDGIVPDLYSKYCVTLKEASRIFWSKHTEEEILSEVSMTKMAPIVMRKMAECPRYENIKLSRYVNHTDEKEIKQFAAVCIKFDDLKTYIAYRGTDGTIVGWKEDFNMSFATVPSQKEAVDYLNFIGNMIPGKLYIGGHSKGGNLAVYSSIKTMDVIKDKIVQIYNNDGPGFSGGIIDNFFYERIRGKIRTYVPKSSIIGMLLEHEEEYVIVDSLGTGMKQHDALSWKVKGTEFEYVEERTSDSVIFDAAVHAMIENMDYNQRQEFVDTLFNILEESGIKLIGDYSNDKWQKTKEMLKIVKENTPSKELLISAGKTFITEATKAATNVVTKMITGKNE